MWRSCTGEQEQFKGRVTQSGIDLGLDDTSKHVVFGIWGDAAPTAHMNSVYMLTWRALTGKHRRRFRICALSKDVVCKCGSSGKHTFDAIFTYLAWAFQVLQHMVFPSHDHECNPLTDAWRIARAGKKLKLGGSLVGKNGDWSWMKQCVGLQGWNIFQGNKRCCWTCLAANTEELNCFDFTASAKWRKTMISMASFMYSTSHGRQHLSPLFKCPGFRLAWCRIDWMHCVCLGVLQYILGNVLFDLFLLLHGLITSPQLACGKLIILLNTSAKQLGTHNPLGHLTLLMFRGDTKKPRLKTKAAEGRHMLSVITIC